MIWHCPTTFVSTSHWIVWSFGKRTRLRSQSLRAKSHIRLSTWAMCSPVGPKVIHRWSMAWTPCGIIIAQRRIMLVIFKWYWKSPTLVLKRKQNSLDWQSIGPIESHTAVGRVPIQSCSVGCIGMLAAKANQSSDVMRCWSIRKTLQDGWRRHSRNVFR